MAAMKCKICGGPIAYDAGMPEHDYCSDSCAEWKLPTELDEITKFGEYEYSIEHLKAAREALLREGVDPRTGTFVASNGWLRFVSRRTLPLRCQEVWGEGWQCQLERGHSGVHMYDAAVPVEPIDQTKPIGWEELADYLVAIRPELARMAGVTLAPCDGQLRAAFSGDPLPCPGGATVSRMVDGRWLCPPCVARDRDATPEPARVPELGRLTPHHDCDCMSCRPWTT